jgi:hypothetical protein
MDGLSKRQVAVIEDLFAGQMDEAEVLEAHKISRSRYNKWLADERFAAAYAERIGRAYRQSQLIIARYAPLAAAKLVQLTGCDSPETARKACLDIIGFSGSGQGSGIGNSIHEPLSTIPEPGQLSDETASRILAALAETNEGRQTTDDG